MRTLDELLLAQDAYIRDLKAERSRRSSKLVGAEFHDRRAAILRDARALTLDCGDWDEYLRIIGPLFRVLMASLGPTTTTQSYHYDTFATASRSKRLPKATFTAVPEWKGGYWHMRITHQIGSYFVYDLGREPFAMKPFGLWTKVFKGWSRLTLHGTDVPLITSMAILSR